MLNRFINSQQQHRTNEKYHRQNGQLPLTRTQKKHTTPQPVCHTSKCNHTCLIMIIELGILLHLKEELHFDNLLSHLISSLPHHLRVKMVCLLSRETSGMIPLICVTRCSQLTSDKMDRCKFKCNEL